LVQLYRWFPSALKAITIIRPETLVRWFGPASPVLALEIPLAWRPTEDRCGTARADPADERSKSSYSITSSARASRLSTSTV